MKSFFYFSVLLVIIMIVLAGFTKDVPDSDANSVNSAVISSFAQKLETKYIDPDRVFSTDVRWWLGTASSTTTTLREEIQAMYDGGFRGVELCMQNAIVAGTELTAEEHNAIYSYGSPQWAYKWKFMINELLDLGMGVYLTSGTHWSTSNVPGLNPDSQEAMQNVAMGTTAVEAGANLSSLPRPNRQRAVAKFIGAYAFKQSDETTYASGNTRENSTRPSFTVDYNSVINLTPLVAQGATTWEQHLDWTAPSDGTWRIFAYWTQGTYQMSNPAVEPSYATNYFDVRGVKALRVFWEANYLDDPVLNQKIMDGDVQLFMDSHEMTQGNGGDWTGEHGTISGAINNGEITFWAEDFAEEFMKRNGYDIRPYLFLTAGLIDGFNMVSNPYYDIRGIHSLDQGIRLRENIIFDYQKFLTDIYMERMLTPLKEWLNSVGIKTRAQISYGRPLEISEPILDVDFPEAESLNQYHQVDIYRLWSGGAKLQNKVLSQEGGTHFQLHGPTTQLILKDAYSHYAAGFQRAVWHIWGSLYSISPTMPWAGDVAGGTGFQRFGRRDPSSRNYDEFNAHLGRVQQLMRTGRSRTDIGFVHNHWFNHIRVGGDGNIPPHTPANITAMNWQFAHQGIYYRSTELQENGYTYDYFSPRFLYDAPEVYFNEEKKTVELAGYKAIVLYQRWLDTKAAEIIFDMAKKGLPVVIVDGAAVYTPFNDGKDAELAEIIDKLKTLPNVRIAKINSNNPDFDYNLPLADGYDDEVMEMLQELGVRPYAAFVEPNYQLLTQSRMDEDGNMYLYVFNYCPNDYHQYSHKDNIVNLDHGTNIQTEIKMDGMFIPYFIDAWTGQVTELAHYRYENGQTVFPIDLDYGNIALFAFEAVDNVKLHIVSTNAESAHRTANALLVRATESGTYTTIMNNGKTFTHTVEVPKHFDITNWDVTVESWDASSTLGDLTREETLFVGMPYEMTTHNYLTSTIITPVKVKLNKLTTWNNISEIGRDVSGTGCYRTTFDWNAAIADGAYLNFGDILVESMKVWINGIKVGGYVSTNPTKVSRAGGSIINDTPVVGKDLYTGGISWTKPVVDISRYLINGKNEIVIEYSSNLTNRQLQREAPGVTEVQHGRNWWNNNRLYRNYGPQQAVIMPFVEWEP